MGTADDHREYLKMGPNQFLSEDVTTMEVEPAANPEELTFKYFKLLVQ